MGIIYILRFDVPLGTDKHQAQYYIGYTDNLESRLEEHRNGTGAAITRALVQRGINFTVVATFSGTRQLERRLKNQKNTARIVKRYGLGTLDLGR